MGLIFLQSPTSLDLLWWLFSFQIWSVWCWFFMGQFHFRLFDSTVIYICMHTQSYLRSCDIIDLKGAWSLAAIFSASLSSTPPSLISSYAGDSHRISHREDLWCWYPLVLCLSNDLLYLSLFLSLSLPFSPSLSPSLQGIGYAAKTRMRALQPRNFLSAYACLA